MELVVSILKSSIIVGFVFYVTCIAIEKTFGYVSKKFRFYMALVCIACIVGLSFIYINGGRFNMTEQATFLLMSSTVLFFVFYLIIISIEKILGFVHKDLRSYMLLICVACIVGSFFLYENDWHWF